MKTIWKDENYVTAYELARNGMSEQKMAKAIGVSVSTLRKWKRNKPALSDAIRRGAGDPNGSSPTQSFHEYIYQKLPPELAELYNQIEACESEPNGIKKIEAILRKHGKRARQHLFLHALVSSNFNVSRACSMIQISRKTFESWVTSEPEFHELMQEMDFHKKNYFESALIGLIARGDSSATIFANKTINRDRGYNEKLDLNVSGTIEHEHLHAHIAVDELQLKIETKKEILTALRLRKQETVDAQVIRELPVQRIG
jgi:transcriptional regulator with XRE-family HTH domain